MKTLLNLFFLLLALQVNAQCWSKIASGASHSIAIKADGTLWTWGKNEFGQLGDGTTVNKFAPVQIGSERNWVAISAGSYHSMALKNDGTLWTWGKNEYGQLGDGTLIDKSIPTQVGTDSDWSSIDAGYHFCTAIKMGTNATLWTWGHNQFGQLGNGTTTNSSVPIQVGSSASWKAVSAGAYHVIALEFVTGGSRLLSWGFNGYGQLGDNTTTNQSSPIQVGTDISWNTISAGSFHNLARKNNGSLWSWGGNSYGQIGEGSAVDVHLPTQITADTNWQSVFSAGFGHSIAKKTNGSIWAWGQNSTYQLGMGNTIQLQTPQQIGSDTNWANSVSAGYTSSALKTDGTLYTWGTGLYGELGNGTTNTTATVPVAIACPTSYLGVAENSMGNSTLKIYPNPSSEMLNIETNINKPISDVKIVDVSGRIVLQQIRNSNKINIQKLQKGNYIVLIKIEDKNYPLKFIKN